MSTGAAASSFSVFLPSVGNSGQEGKQNAKVTIFYYHLDSSHYRSWKTAESENFCDNMSNPETIVQATFYMRQ